MDCKAFIILTDVYRRTQPRRKRLFRTIHAILCTSFASTLDYTMDKKFDSLRNGIPFFTSADCQPRETLCYDSFART